MEDLNPAKRQKKENSFVSDANQALTFHLASLSQPDGKELQDLAGAEAFGPEMCHQAFGDDELIAGYQDLAVNVYMHPCTMQAYLQIQYSSKKDPAEDIHEKLQEWFPDGDLTTDKQQFLQWLQSGEQLQTEGVKKLLESDFEDDEKLEVYHCNLATAPESFKTLHSRLQPLLIFYIDAASYLDADDTKWEVLVALRRTSEGLFPVGFCSVYKFYVFPDRSRLRLSQMLVLPPYQRQGVGSKLLEGLYKLAKETNAVDVTVEDGAEDLQMMRQKLDLTLLEDRPDIAAAVTRAVNSTTPGALMLPAPLLKSLHAELKLAKCQLRVTWEALLYLRSEMRTGKGKTRLQQLIRNRIDGSAEKEKLSAAVKRLIDNGEKGWIMSKNIGLEGAAAAPTSTSVSEEEAHHKEQVAEAVAHRMQQLQMLAESVQ